MFWKHEIYIFLLLLPITTCGEMLSAFLVERSPVLLLSKYFITPRLGSSWKILNWLREKLFNFHELSILCLGWKSFLPGNYPLLVSKSQFPVLAQSSILASDINWWTKESNVVGFHNLVDNNKVKLNTLQHHSESSCCSQTKLKMFISDSSVYFTSSAKSGCWRV